MARSKLFYLVRHAESDNNANQHNDNSEQVPADVGSTPPAKKARQADPGLSSRGLAQADSVARLLKRLAECEDPTFRPSRIYTSAFLRALQTTQPIAEALDAGVALQLDVGENGGIFDGPRSCYTNGEVHSLPHKYGLCGPRIRSLLPAVEGACQLPEEGWWKGGCETLQETRVRVKCVVDWMWDLVAAEPQPGDKDAAAADDRGAVVVVTHGAFMDGLFKALFGCEVNGGTQAMFLTANCGYWLLKLEIPDEKDKPTKDGQRPPRRVAVLAANVVDHVPTAFRTGHTMNGVHHCPPSFPDLHGDSSSTTMSNGTPVGRGGGY
eukprot:TRINITY_DN28538_c0_g1_i1.p1 TRINITY_DN28538_c0_g1~~TRINITY_DN28538_c0_g1_i1.p1  ORF type:complete len:360 (+),score=55.95 TRINITY_DN28538_c0_g1_i1:112-1080(+)